MACDLDPGLAAVSCRAENFDRDSWLKWTSNATTRWGNGPQWDFELGEVPIPVVTVVSFEVCQGSDCQVVSTSVDTSTLASTAPADPGEPSTATSAPTTTTVPELDPPVLERFPIGPFGPYDPSSQTSGVLEFNSDRFIRDGYLRPIIEYAGEIPQHHVLNGTIEFHVPSDTLVYAPIDGIVEAFGWHDNEGLHQDWDDWSIRLKPLSDGRPAAEPGAAPAPFTWIVGIDHVVSLSCPRPRNWPDVCRLLPVVDGVELELGMTVRSGQILGYAGNLADYEDTGLDGRVEISVDQGTDDWRINKGYCPLLFLTAEARATIGAEIRDFMVAYETWADDPDVYDQDEMVVPGCYYARADYDKYSGGEWADETWYKELE